MKFLHITKVYEVTRNILGNNALFYVNIHKRGVYNGRK